jgi:hypothetical protein
MAKPKPLDYESLNENVKKSAYAVRGELYLRASELQKEGKKVCFLFSNYILHLLKIPFISFLFFPALKTDFSFFPFFFNWAMFHAGCSSHVQYI